MFVSTHTHFETFMSGATISSMVAQAQTLGRKYLAYTDHSSLTGLLKAYKEAGDKGIQLIPGCEILIDPATLPFKKLAGYGYVSITLYAKTQPAYQKIAKFLSAPIGKYQARTEDELALFSYTDLLALADEDIDAVLCGAHSLTGKLLLLGQRSDARAALRQIKASFPSTYVSLTAFPQTGQYHRHVRIKFEGVDEFSVPENSAVYVDFFAQGKFKRFKTTAAELTLPGASEKAISSIVVSGSIVKIKNKKLLWAKTENKFISAGYCLSSKVNREHNTLAEQEDVDALICDYSYLASEDEKLVQDSRLEGKGMLEKPLYMLSKTDVLDEMQRQGFAADDTEHFIDNTLAWARRFDGLKLKYEWRLPKVTDNIDKSLRDILQATGRMRWDDPVWLERLRYELAVFRKNGKLDLLPYFMPIAMVFKKYREAGQLTGPSRGSVGGSLLAYVMGFTHLNPLEYDLPFERFFSMDRINTKKLPDVDIDLPDRSILVGEDGQGGYLKEIFGDKFAQISVRGNIRLKSAMLDVNRYFNDGTVDPEIAKISESLPNPPQGIADKDYVFGYKDSEGHQQQGLIEYNKEIQDYAAKYPDQWAIVRKMLGIPRQNGRHASAFVLADVPINDIVPTMTINGFGPVTQYEAKEVEAAGLIKYDFLCLTQLKDLQSALALINKKNGSDYEVGWFDHEGKKTYIWDLPKSDSMVSQMVQKGELSTLFQIHTQSMRPFVMDIKPISIEDYATILALVRPGPLDYIDKTTGRNMAEEYIERRFGRSKPDVQSLADVLPNTYGIIVFQEDLTKIAKVIAKMPGDRAEILRDNMCKKRKKALLEMRPEFMKGAVESVGAEEAQKIWEMMETFGQYGFSIIHSIGYAMISYATAFLKTHYPLEWWAAILSNADSKEISQKYWRNVRHLVAPPDINLSTEETVVDYQAGKIRSKLSMIAGLSENGVREVVSGRPYKNLQDLVNKGTVGDSMLKKLMQVGVLDSLLVNPSLPLVHKMVALNDCFKQREHAKKLAAFVEKQAEWQRLSDQGIKKPKPREPAAPEASLPDPEYMAMGPLDILVAQKTLMPSMDVDVTETYAAISDLVTGGVGNRAVMNDRGRKSPLLSGSRAELMDKEDLRLNKERVYYACVGIVVEAKEFSFKKGKSKALKMLVDTDGYLREVVIWPDYNTQILDYSPDIGKGAVVLMFFMRRQDKKTATLLSVDVVRRKISAK